jgi:hypothetical protein
VTSRQYPERVRVASGNLPLQQTSKVRLYLYQQIFTLAKYVILGHINILQWTSGLDPLRWTGNLCFEVPLHASEPSALRAAHYPIHRFTSNRPDIELATGYAQRLKFGLSLLH